MDCYSCNFRGSVLGSHHSCCKFPGTKHDMFDLFADENQIMSHVLNVQVSTHGFTKGWAFWPVNFDPIWIDQCWGYLNKEDPIEGRERFSKMVEIYQEALNKSPEDVKVELQKIIDNLKKALELTVKTKV